MSRKPLPSALQVGRALAPPFDHATAALRNIPPDEHPLAAVTRERAWQVPKTLDKSKAHETLMAAIHDRLVLMKIPHTRVNQRPVLTKKGWRTPGADPGTWDMIAVVRGKPTWIEAKSGAARLTSDQVLFRQRMGEDVFAWVVCRNAAELVL